MKHTGSCHCGAVRFRFEADIDHARECDCSDCAKRGLLTFRVAAEALEILTPLEEMSVYRWGTKTAADYFCRTCGILPFRKPSRPTPEERESGVDPFDGWAINLRYVDGLDLDRLPRVPVAGSALKI
jgi:hypothetical protein